MKNDKILKTIIKFLEKRGSITEKKIFSHTTSLKRVI